LKNLKTVKNQKEKPLKTLKTGQFWKQNLKFYLKFYLKNLKFGLLVAPHFQLVDLKKTLKFVDFRPQKWIIGGLKIFKTLKSVPKNAGNHYDIEILFNLLDHVCIIIVCTW
jgi:hypothetical protein